MKTDLVAYKGHNYPVWDVEFSPLGYYFATASHDRTARIWRYSLSLFRLLVSNQIATAAPTTSSLCAYLRVTCLTWRYAPACLLVVHSRVSAVVRQVPPQLQLRRHRLERQDHPPMGSGHRRVRASVHRPLRFHLLPRLQP